MNSGRKPLGKAGCRRIFECASAWVILLILLTSPLCHQNGWSQTFAWTNLAGGDASGSWAKQANWSGGTLPSTPTSSVLFNGLNVTANSTISLDGNTSAGSLTFSDQDPGTPANWIINAGMPASSILTIGGVNPVITVTNLGSGNAVVINAVLGGTTGFTELSDSHNYLQLNAYNVYSGATILSSAAGNCSISLGNNHAFGTGRVLVGAVPGDGQVWFQCVGPITLTNTLEIRTVRWIIDNATVNGGAAGDLTVNGGVLLNTGGSNVRDIYCNQNCTINGNVSVTPANNPVNKQGGYTLTLNGTNTVGGASAVNGGTLIVNGPMNGGAGFTVNSGSMLGGTGIFSGTISVAGGGQLTAGSSSGGTLTCGGLTSVPKAIFNYALGSTNNPHNGLIRVSGNTTLAGTLNITDLGGFSSGVYTGLQCSGSVTLNGLTAGAIPGGKALAVDASSTPGYVLFWILNGTLNPAPAANVPMDLATPLTLSWLQVPGAQVYDVYLGTLSSLVDSATTNTSGIYQGRTNGLTLTISSLQPNTTYYWRVDGVPANGMPSRGTVYSFTTGAPEQDLMEDTWVAADALNRSLPGLAECGSPRTNQPIGLFYYLWHHNSGTYGSGTNWDCSRWLAANPYADPHNPWASNPIFQTVPSTYWWGQPALNYYDPSDPWVLRRQIALLNHAGIDVLLFDYSNAVTYDTQLYALLDIIRQMRFEGQRINLKIAFLTHAGSGATSTYLYNTLYAPGKYSDLWYYWQGKPLLLGYVNGSGGGDPVPAPAVQNFFTWRTSWAFVATNQLHDEWQWVDVPTPQNWGYDTRPDLPEELPVSCGGWANGNIGKSQSNNSQPDYDNHHLPLQHTSRLGIFFKEQMNYGLKYDPQFLFLTQWNEWIAGSYPAPTYCYTRLLADCCPVSGFYFVDEYNEEYSRDLEPMQGGHTDNYYFQMVAQNRQRKGVRPVPAASGPQTISLAGDFSQWTNVAPAYYDPANDTIWRNYPGASASQMGTYVNTSGRNDFTVLKVARDASNIYFFAQCNSNLTARSGSNWMVLFLDVDQNHQTGWEGYDYAINLGPRTATATSLSQNTTVGNAWTWTTVRSDIAYKVSGNQLMLAIPRASLGLGTDPIQFDFHWADNFQTNDIADFGVDGDSAPDRRFNYRYITTTNAEVTLLADDFENGRQPIWGQSWTIGSQWSLTTATPYSGNYCAVAHYAPGGQSNLVASANTAGYGSLRLNFHYKLSQVLNATPLVISYLTTNGWVPIKQLSRDEYYSIGQSWPYDEQQNVWLNFTDTRYNTGPDARFFTTNFAFRIDASALTATGQSVFIDSVSLAADTQMPAALPLQAWQSQDIGNAGNTGFVATNGNTFTVSGSGLDIFNNGDAFRLLYLTRTGDGQLTARVTGITPTDPWAKAGVMIRESLDSGARNVSTFLSAGNGLTFQQRATPLAATASTTLGAPVTPPYWVRVVRQDTNFTGYISVDGTNWTPGGTARIGGFSRTALWGLAVTAHNNTLTNVATFDHVTVDQSPWILTQPQGQFVAPGSNLVLTVQASGDSPLFYQWQKDGLTLTDGGKITGSTTATLTVSNLATAEAGIYSVTISNDLGSVTSAGATVAERVNVSNIQNNGFEVPTLGSGFTAQPAGAAWTFDSAGSGISCNGSGFTSGNSPAPEGVQVAYLQGVTTISQSLAFAAGSYQLAFSAAQRANFPQAGQTFNVTLDGRVIGSFAPPESATNYVDYVTGIFTVTKGNHTLAFAGTDTNGGDNTILIDNLRMLGLPPMQLSSGSFSSNTGFALSVQGQAGQSFILQATTNLAFPAAWLALQTNLLIASPFSFTDTFATNFLQRFYRVESHQ